MGGFDAGPDRAGGAVGGNVEAIEGIAIGLVMVGGFCFLLCRYHERFEKSADWFYNLSRRGK